MENIEYRKLIALILNASTKITRDHRRGAANFIRVPDRLSEKFPGNEIAGIPVHSDTSLQDTIVVGRIEETGFLAEEIIHNV